MTETKHKVPKSVLLSAIGAIVILEGIALLKGVNGMILTLSIGAIAGLAGWVAPQLRVKK